MEVVTASARLLVVEDEATILDLLSGSLRLAGFEVVTAASGDGAVRGAVSSRPDLVPLDVMMPHGDGFDALRRIRSGGCEVPVIFLTARAPDRRSRHVCHATPPASRHPEDLLRLRWRIGLVRNIGATRKTSRNNLSSRCVADSRPLYP